MMLRSSSDLPKLSPIEHPLFRDPLGLLQRITDDLFVVTQVALLTDSVDGRCYELKVLVQMVTEAMKRSSSIEDCPERNKLVSAAAKGLVLLHLSTVMDPPNSPSILSLSSMDIARQTATRGLVDELLSIVSLLKIQSPIELLELIESLPFSVNPIQYSSLLEAVLIGTPVVGNGRSIDSDWGFTDDFQELVSESSECLFDSNYFLQRLLQFVFYIDSYGFSSLAVEVLNESLKIIDESRSAISHEMEENNELMVLGEVRNHLFHFCNLVYDSFLPVDTLFIDWLLLPTDGKVNMSIVHTGKSNMSIAVLLQNVVVPMMEGDQRLWMYVSDIKELTGMLMSLNASSNCIGSKEYVERVVSMQMKGHKECDNGDLSVNRLISKELIRVLRSETITKDEMLQQILEVLQSDIFEAERDFEIIVELIVHACEYYDDIDSGLELIEEIINSLSEEEYINHLSADDDNPFLLQYQQLRSVVAYCRVLKQYMQLPPLAVLVSGPKNRVLRWTYKLKLLVGCGFYIPNSSDVNAIHTSLTLEQCIIIRMCTDFHSLYISNQEQKSWYSLCLDIHNLCKYCFTEQDYSQWAAQMIFQCLLYFDIESEYSSAVATVLREKNIDVEEEESTIGYLLLEMEVSQESVKTMLLDKSKDILNSVSSLYDPLVDTAKKIFNLIPGEDQTVEQKFYELIDFIVSLELDFIPIQLRMMTANDMMEAILNQRPEAYFAIISYGVSLDESNASTALETKQDILAYESVLDSKPINCNFYELLIDLLEKSEGKSPEDMLAVQLQLTISLIKVALSLSDFENVYCLVMSLLKPIQLNYGNLDKIKNRHILDDVVEVTLLVIQIFKTPTVTELSVESEATTSERYFNCKLGHKLQSELIAACPATSLEKLINVNSFIEVDRPVGNSQIDFAIFCLDKSKDLFSKLIDSVGSDDIYTSLSLDAIIDEAFNYCILISDSELSLKSLALFEQFVKDLEHKLLDYSYNQSADHTNSKDSLPNESFISQLVTKGFSYNGAKKAVINTENRNLKEALLWAVEHSLDKDFDYPIAQAVSGALLSSSAANGQKDSNCIQYLLKSAKQKCNIFKSIVLKTDCDFETKTDVPVSFPKKDATIKRDKLEKKGKAKEKKVTKLDFDDNSFASDFTYEDILPKPTSIIDYNPIHNFNLKENSNEVNSTTSQIEVLECVNVIESLPSDHLNLSDKCVGAAITDELFSPLEMIDVSDNVERTVTDNSSYSLEEKTVEDQFVVRRQDVVKEIEIVESDVKNDVAIKNSLNKIPLSKNIDKKNSIPIMKVNKNKKETNVSKVKKLKINPDEFFDEIPSMNPSISVVQSSDNNENKSLPEIITSSIDHSTEKDINQLHLSSKSAIDTSNIIIPDKELCAVVNENKIVIKSVVDQKPPKNSSTLSSGEDILKSKLSILRDEIVDLLQESLYFDRKRIKSKLFTDAEIDYSQHIPDGEGSGSEIVADISHCLSNHIIGTRFDMETREKAFRMLSAILFESSLINGNISNDKLMDLLNGIPEFLIFISGEVRNLLRSAQVKFEEHLSILTIINWYIAAVKYREAIIVSHSSGDELVTTLILLPNW